MLGLVIYISHFLKTTRYGLKSIYRKSIENWNYFTKHFKDINVSDLSILFNYCFFVAILE